MVVYHLIFTMALWGVSKKGIDSVKRSFIEKNFLSSQGNSKKNMGKVHLHQML